MGEIKFYLALLAWVIWVCIATYWISSRMCVDLEEHRNNMYPETYQEIKNVPLEEADGLEQTVPWIE